MDLRFHWMLPKGGEVSVGAAQATAEFRARCCEADSPAARPDMEGWLRFAKTAEAAGIESILISCGPYEPDALLVACALGRATERLKFIAAYRSGWMQPTSFVQQFNTISALIGGRIALNLVAGSSTKEQHMYGDFLSHDERYARAEEFLSVCNSYWRSNEKAVNFKGEYYQVENGKLHTLFEAPDRTTPEIYVAGHSEQACNLAVSQATCLMRVVDTPDKLRTLVGDFRERGIEVCLRLGLICRDTRENAIQAARALLPEDYVGKQQSAITAKDDSQMYREATQVSYDAEWANDTVWSGLVRYYGPVWTFLVGTPEELAKAILEYKNIGVTQFIMSGCPEIDEIGNFSREVLPRVREAEKNS